MCRIFIKQWLFLYNFMLTNINVYMMTDKQQLTLLKVSMGCLFGMGSHISKSLCCFSFMDHFLTLILSKLMTCHMQSDNTVGSVLQTVYNYSTV